MSERAGQVLRKKVPTDPLWCPSLRERRITVETPLRPMEPNAPGTRQTV